MLVMLHWPCLTKNASLPPWASKSDKTLMSWRFRLLGILKVTRWHPFHDTFTGLQKKQINLNCRQNSQIQATEMQQSDSKLGSKKVSNIVTFGRAECSTVSYLLMMSVSSWVHVLILFWASIWVMNSVLSPLIDKMVSPGHRSPWAALLPDVI